MVDGKQVAAATREKETRLKEMLAKYGAMALAYSGGVDSTYLACVAHEVLGPRLLLVLADSPNVPRWELEEAKALAEARGWRLRVIALDPFADAAFLKNDDARCYHCKQKLFDRMKACAVEEDITVFAHGENVDDLADGTRVGSKAAVECGAVAPLQEVGLTKTEIRALSAVHRLPTHDKPSMACLATRVPTGTPLSKPALAQVEQAEDALRALGFRQCRARHHGMLCRIELERGEMGKLLADNLRQNVVEALREAGFEYVTLDLVGYGEPRQTP